MQNPSRRLFFGGKKPEISPWDQLLLQLQRKTQGTLRELDVESESESESEQVVFCASLLTDLHQARQLCHAYGASLHLCGSGESIVDVVKPIVWLDLRTLNQLMPLDAEKKQWFIQAGVTMGQLKEAGFKQLSDLPDELSVAAWLAEPSYHRYLLSDISHSGLVHASLLTADGLVNSLGSFGAQNTKPLNTAFLQQTVPQLFELADTEAAQALFSQPHWLGRYRLDIFSPNNKQLNLAHLLLGHQGALGLLEWVVIDQSLFKKAPASRSEEAVEPTLVVAAQELDAAVKHLFDPEGVFSD